MGAVLVVGMLVLGALLGAASSVLRGPTYTSEAQLSYNPSVRSQLDPDYNAPDSTTFDREVADQGDVILSDAVVGKVVSALDVDAGEVRRNLDVTTTAGRSEILITGSGSTPAAAQRLTRSATDAYVATLKARNAALLEQRIAALKPVIAELRRQLASVGSNAEGGALADDIATLQSQQAGYTVAQASIPVEVVVQREAERPEGPSSLSPLVTAVLGAVLGAVLAVCLLLLLATRRRSRVAPAASTRGDAERAAARGAVPSEGGTAQLDDGSVPRADPSPRPTPTEPVSTDTAEQRVAHAELPAALRARLEPAPAQKPAGRDGRERQGTDEDDDAPRTEDSTSAARSDYLSADAEDRLVDSPAERETESTGWFSPR